MSLRSPLAAVLVVAPLTGCSADDGGGVSAVCAAPVLRVADGEVAPGAQLRVTGRYFFDDCHDQGEAGDPPASQDVVLTLRQGGEAYDLGAADARPDGRASWTVTLPDQIEPGRAVMRAGTSETLRVQARQPEAADGREIRTTTSAVCEAPSIRLADREVSPGEQIAVRGRAFDVGCDDTGGQGERSRPQRDIALDLVQGDRSWSLAVASADSRGRVVWTVEVPEDTGPGPATLVPGAAQELEIEVVAD